MVRAVVCKEFGPPEKLVVETVEDPRPGEGEVVVDVRAAAITFPDTLIIEDRYQFKATPPFTLGGEVAGSVSAIGQGVSDFAIGDDVVGGRGTGGFAERLAVPATALRPLPLRSTMTNPLFSTVSGFDGQFTSPNWRFVAVR